MGKSNEVIQDTIIRLEQKRDQDLLELKQQLRATGQSLKPSNMIKDVVHEVTESKKIKSLLIKAAIGVAIGFAAKKLIGRQRAKVNVKNKFLGDALKYGLNVLTARRNGLIKAAGLYAANHILNTIRKKRMQRRHLHNGEPANQY